LLDEPFSNLDVGTRIKLRREFRVLLEKLKVTTVLVTHDQEEALAVGDRLAVLQGGRIVQVGMGMELYNRPATAFVAGFLGNPGMNLIPVLLERGGLIEANTKDPLLSRLAPKVAQSMPGGAATLGFRAAAAVIGDSTAAPDECRLSGTVELIEPSTPRRRVVVRCGESEMIVDDNGVVPITRGEKIWVHVPFASCFLFRTDSDHSIVWPQLER
jgi:ABC-type sugar transport system ATPase subunit